jgi:hypothetical protein
MKSTGLPIKQQKLEQMMSEETKRDPGVETRPQELEFDDREFQTQSLPAEDTRAVGPGEYAAEQRRVFALQLAANLQVTNVDELIKAAIKIDDYLIDGEVITPDETIGLDTT